MASQDLSVFGQGSTKTENSAGFVVENLFDLMRYKLLLYEISVMILWNIANAESIQKLQSYFKIRSKKSNSLDLNKLI